jgi:hypothetical protein
VPCSRSLNSFSSIRVPNVFAGLRVVVGGLGCPPVFHERAYFRISCKLCRHDYSRL